MENIKNAQSPVESAAPKTTHKPRRVYAHKNLVVICWKGAFYAAAADASQIKPTGKGGATAGFTPDGLVKVTQGEVTETWLPFAR